jgi:hypothetical protein
MLESALHRLMPEAVNTFAKLERGEPCHFDRWADDRVGSACLYYRFIGAKKYTKRLPVSEIRAALKQLRVPAWFSRETFREVCPPANRDGQCGFAVGGRILEALKVAEYSGLEEFKLNNANEATNLLETKPR